ncbi:hypothetical protein RGQ21_17240 [Kitasatospora aureofaciens]|nr:hypothetical protein RGQ21_17240 [Kitasatospora aureofaciens]
MAMMASSSGLPSLCWSPNGRTNDEIARELVVSPLTAKTHVSRIMAKLGARDRSQVVVMAYEYRMVSPGWLTD